MIKNLFTSIKSMDDYFIVLKLVNENFDIHYNLLLDWSETYVEYCTAKLSF